MPFIVNWATGANVYQVRNQCLGAKPELGPNQKPFQGQFKYDYIMWFDSDQEWRVKDFNALLQIMRERPEIKALTAVYPRVAEDRSDVSTICSITKHPNGIISQRLLTAAEVDELPELGKVDASGLGFCIMRSGVIESIDYPWFMPVFSIDKKIRKPVFFMSEDMALFVRLKEAGIDLWCASKIRIGHEKEKTYYLK
jgi:GT2 family glycosyltransferase